MTVLPLKGRGRDSGAWGKWMRSNILSFYYILFGGVILVCCSIIYYRTSFIYPLSFQVFLQNIQEGESQS